MSLHPLCRFAFLILLPLLYGRPAIAQESAPRAEGEFRTIGSMAEDQVRLEHLLGRHDTGRFLLRSPSLHRDTEPAAGPNWRLLPPELTTIWNSDIPFSLNEGDLWAGRGLNLRLRAGVRLRWSAISLTVAPELTHSENAAFQTLPYPADATPPRSPFASPFYGPPESADVPIRFGPDPITRVTPGQSSLSVDLGGATIGLSTESHWWGPGIRNALVLSNNAPGFVHGFVRPRQQVSTRFGEFDARWILGSLRESDYFDADPTNDHRSLNAVAVTLRPSIEPDLTLGLARAVVANRSSGAIPIGAAFDALRSVGRPNAVRENEEAGSADQVFSLFGRWIFPRAGFESYFEWARFEQPASVRDLLVAPNHSQGYTLGLQWARSRGPQGAIRLQAELSYLEPSTTFKQRPVTSAYASRSVPQGYTHDGRVLGAAIGPGASSQWLAADLIARRWQFGAFAGRVRWNEGVLPRAVGQLSILRHDVSVLGGFRGGARLPMADVDLELLTEGRFNFLFQNPVIGLFDPAGVDIRNHVVKVRVQPRW